MRKLLLPDRADVLDDGRFHHRLLAGVQHAGDRDRHAPHGVELRHQPADAFGAARIRIGADRADQLGQHVIGLEEALGAGTLIGELARRLLPGAVDLAEHVILRHEEVGEDDLVELVLAGDLADRVHLDARLLHLDQKLGQAVTAVFLGRLRRPEDRDHVVGDMRRRGPDLGAVDEIAAVGLGRARLRGEQVGAGVRLAHADRKADLAAADARQDVHLDVFRGVFQQHRPALAVGDEEAPRRRVGDAHLLGHHVTFEEGALLAAIFLRPGHAEPALGADPAGKFRRVGVFAVGLVRIEGAGGDFLGEEGAHFLAQLLALLGQADRIETEGSGHVFRLPDQREATSGHNSSAPRLATSLPSSTAQWLSEPKSSRQASARSE